MSTNSIEASSLFKGIFDLQFDSFVTLKIVRVIYVIQLGISLGIAFIFFGLGIYSIGSLLHGKVEMILFAIVGAPLGFLLSTMISRVSLELIVIIFRIAENTEEIVLLNESE